MNVEWITVLKPQPNGKWSHAEYTDVGCLSKHGAIHCQKRLELISEFNAYIDENEKPGYSLPEYFISFLLLTKLCNLSTCVIYVVND